MIEYESNPAAWGAEAGYPSPNDDGGNQAADERRGDKRHNPREIGNKVKITRIGGKTLYVIQRR